MTTVAAKPAAPAAEEERHRLTALEGVAALSLDALSSVAYGPEAAALPARRGGPRHPADTGCVTRRGQPGGGEHQHVVPDVADCDLVSRKQPDGALQRVPPALETSAAGAVGQQVNQ